MRYFKDINNKFFGIDVGQEDLIKSNWVEITKEEIDASNVPTPEQIKRNQILKLKNKLAETDYKDLPSYDKRGTAEWNQLMQERQAWRNEIRSLEQG